MSALGGVTTHLDQISLYQKYTTPYLKKRPTFGLL